MSKLAIIAAINGELDSMPKNFADKALSKLTRSELEILYGATRTETDSKPHVCCTSHCNGR